ncbi:cbb3-type cytochrome oxidase assembly protein CcoS [Elizabethkingia anophelis]|uniref:Cbb3-type cytochrome oxidase assembly protein CcoS n=1 Tax=Elizabethkingia anophelis R26 TaxID=1246994 RepID=A0ABN5BY80_9FLAO|nr:cbb3-type cytochrome oxidase assembly protein CcoS [Elizabethkingia anophelis]ATC36612.1 cbb3-type cytochrome oxidase assembly protein CcoS [Elizabethkingia anophelis R26]ATC40289.1 cbb3-type cytochrome oxidase assembly protein CcoS [Elizabethkingia anophelis Ag1]ATC43967.1 cbb3-type cytochrome oxidase assembly protein CcoS [Elizabethkingia anophelis]ATC47643.1 cbb3-type cytochrome oxidase assembly protein CcoS [Elizabethkingia anophelis]MCQ0430003.1 cbb3-type cytochrome oxidase assembly pr
MDILYLMIICSVSLAVIFLIIFIIGAKNGQFEDDESPAVRMLFDSEVQKEKDEDKRQTEDEPEGDEKIDKK